MITATIIAKETLDILAITDISSYTIEQDIEFDGKSSFEVSHALNVHEQDFILLRNDERIVSLGIVSTIENESGNNLHVIHFTQIETIFDRDIFLDGEEIIRDFGIEEFIRQCIYSNFVFNDDEFINQQYLEVQVLTNTKVIAKVENENGIFNLKTYMANMLERYGIGYMFKFEDRKLVIEIKKLDPVPLKIDTQISDIVNCSEVYETVTIGATSIHNFYLLTDRTISKDKTNENRAGGKIVTEYFEFETYEELLEEVTQRFKSNSYSHSVEVDIYQSSLIYPMRDLFIGRECVIKTKTRGIKQSLITRVAYSNKSQFINIKFGKMKVTLLEKLKKERKNG